MSIANPLWGAPRIHGELLKLGIDVGQTTVAKYMEKRRRPPSQGWKTFLRNHADGIASIDMFVVPTVSFRLLYGLLILQHARRELLWLGVTAHPNAQWIAQQLTEAYGWKETPRYLIRDRDSAYGEVFIRRVGAMGIRDRPITPRRHGRTDTRRGSSVRSDGIALTTWLSLANGTFVTCFSRIRDTTTRLARTCRCTRTRPSRARCGHSAACFRCQSWAASTINTFGSEFPTRTEAGFARERKLKSVREHQAGLQSFRSMRRIDARRKNPSAFRNGPSTPPP